MKNYQSISINNDDDEGGALLGSYGANNNKNNLHHPRHVVNTHPEDHLVPPFDAPSSQRPSTLFSGTFNLVATIIGGAVFSLPVVFHKCGVAFTTIAMLLSAYMTYISLVMLTYCSRRGGGSSYGEVVRSAFGTKMEEGVSWLLFVFLMFVITSFMVLIRDICTPLVVEVAGITDATGDSILLVVIVAMLPFLFQRSLHALRYNCYVGAASILVLCVALCRGGWQRLDGEFDESDRATHTTIADGGVEIWKLPSPSDFLFAFPIVTCSFLCHFNIIAIQNALQKPTRARMERLIGFSIAATFTLMYTFGLGGYLYAGSRTEGNILLNVPMARLPGEDSEEYYLFLLGRIGCGTTIMLALPIIVLPCREALLEVIDVWFHHSHHLPDDESADVPAAVDNDKLCWKLFRRCNKSETVQDAAITTEDEVTEIVTERRERGNSISSQQSCVLIRHEPIQSDYVFRNTLAHYGSTLLIAASCYLGATAVSGVATVWSFIGSSMGVVIAFVLPCGCFVVIEGGVTAAAEGGDRKDGLVLIARAILWFSIVGAAVCTINNTVGFGL